MKRLLLFILFLWPLALHSQSSFLIPVQTTTGQGISGATVTLTCTDTTNGCVGKGPFSATSTNGNASFTAIPAGNYTVAITGPNLTTFSYAYTVGIQPNGGILNPSIISNVVYLGGLTYPCSDVGINAAITTITPLGGGKIDGHNCTGTTTAANPLSFSIGIDLDWPAGTLLLNGSPGINCSAGGVGSTIHGAGEVATVIKSTSSTADMFSAGCQALTIKDLDIVLNNSVARSTTPGTNCVIRWAQQQGLVQHVRVIGPASVNGGDIFCHPSSSASAETYRDVDLIGGAIWSDGWVLQSSSGTVSQVTIEDSAAFNSTFTNQLVDADTLVDTLTIRNLQSGATTPFVIHAQNTLAGQAPRFVNLDASHLECGGTGAGVVLQLDVVRDFTYSGSGYLGTCQTAVVFGAGAAGATVADTTVVNIGRDCFDWLAGSVNTIASVLNIQDCGQATAGDVFSIAPGTQGFHIGPAKIGSTTSTKPRWGVNIQSSASTGFFSIFGVDGTSVAFTSGSCTNGSTGSDQHLFMNPGSSCQDKNTDTSSSPSIFSSVQTGPVLSQGTVPTLAGTGACATFSTQLGGAWAGSFKCTGTTGAATMTLTLVGLTAPNAWSCDIKDETTVANSITQTVAGSPTTTCTASAAAITSGDVIRFTAFPY